MSLRDRKILTFDVVGTLIDFEAGLIAYFRPIVAAAGLDIDDATILTSFATAEDEQHHLTPGIPFTAMLPAIYRTMAAKHGLPADDKHVEGLRLSMEFWPAFPDSIEGMKALRKRFRLVALTNADNWALAHFARTLEEHNRNVARWRRIEEARQQVRDAAAASGVAVPEGAVPAQVAASRMSALFGRMS